MRSIFLLQWALIATLIYSNWSIILKYNALVDRYAEEVSWLTFLVGSTMDLKNAVNSIPTR
jgi:hypothetical protein